MMMVVVLVVVLTMMMVVVVMGLVIMMMVLVWRLINSHSVACGDDGDGGDACNHITKTPYMIL